MKTQLESQKPSQNPVEFITKLQSILQVPLSSYQNCPNIVSYSQDGKQIIIHNFERFTNEVLPHYFRHNKWKSFIRQMNMYGFRKICREIQTQIFVHDFFCKGNQHNFYLIQRKNLYKNDQPQIKPNYQQQVFQIMSQQSILNGIPPNSKLLQLSENLQVNSHTSPTLPSFSLSLQNPSKKHAQQHHITSLECLDQKEQKKYSINNDFQQEKEQQKYMNSVLYFIKNIISQQKNIQKLTQNLKTELTQITKNPKNKNNTKSHNNLKQSFKLIDQVSTQFKYQIEQYVQNKDIPQKKLTKNKKDTINKPLMPIIPQRISPRLHNTMKIANPPQNPVASTSSLFNMMLDSFPFIQKAQRKDSLEQQLQLQLEAHNAYANQNVKRENDEGCWQRNSKNGINNGNLVNKLGLSSMCSFSSVTNLLNFDKE